MSSELTSYITSTLSNLDHIASKNAAQNCGLSHMASTYGDIQAMNWQDGSHRFGLQFFLWVERLMNTTTHAAPSSLKSEVSEIIKDYL